MTLRTLDRRYLGLLLFVYLAVTYPAVFVDGVGMVGALFLFGKPFGLLAFQLSRLTMALKAFLNIVARLQIVERLALVVVMALAAADLVIDTMLLVGEQRKALLVFVR